MLKYDFDRLLKRLKKLSKNKRAIFAASCAERLIPGYIEFSKKQNWGDIDFMNKALDIIWQYGKGINIDINIIKNLMDECRKKTPDTEDFESILTDSALNLGAAVYYGLGCVIEDKPEYSAYAGNHAIEAVDRYIITSEKINDEDKIKNHSLMQKELEHQENDLRKLESIKNISNDILKYIKESSKSQPIPFLLDYPNE